jgi:ribosome-associated toxin RatA of RatAB toxin-antitoxin module
MAQAEFHEVLPVDKDKLFQTVTRYEDYPKFVAGCTKVEVERQGEAQARVKYFVSMMKDIVYTVDHTADPAAGVVTWDLVSSDAMRKNSGRWELKSAGAGKTDVRYAVDIEFLIPVPGFILSKLVKGNLPAMVKSFVKQAQKG